MAVDRVSVSRQAEERLLDSERRQTGRASSGSVERDPEPERRGLPRAPAPVADVQSRAAAVEAYRQTAAQRADVVREELQRSPEPRAESAPLPGGGEAREGVALERGQPERAVAEPIERPGGPDESTIAERPAVARPSGDERAAEEAVERELPNEVRAERAERARTDRAAAERDEAAVEREERQERAPDVRGREV
ncbi:MAG: hypothetical protein AAFZ65_15295, partial [Planctomycetota bacterium]